MDKEIVPSAEPLTALLNLVMPVCISIKFAVPFAIYFQPPAVYLALEEKNASVPATLPKKALLLPICSAL